MNKALELIDKLNYYTQYYNKGESLISDREWDNLYFELAEMKKNTGVAILGTHIQIIRYKRKLK